MLVTSAPRIRPIRVVATAALLAGLVGVAVPAPATADPTRVGARAGWDVPARGGDVLRPDEVVEAPDAGRQLASAPTVSGAERLRVVFGTGADAVPSAYRPEVLQAAAALGGVLGPGPQVGVKVTMDPTLPDGILGMGGATQAVTTPIGCVTSSQFVGQGGADLPGEEMRVVLSGNTARWDATMADPADGVPVSLLYTTLLHEMVHGLGLGSTASRTGGELDFLPCAGGGALEFDRLLQDAQGTSLVDLPASAALAAGTSRTTIASNPAWPAYTPSTWTQGSSLSHFDESLEEGGLMGPNADFDRFALGEATLDALTALGWTPVGPPRAPARVQATWDADAGDAGVLRVTWESVAAAAHGYTVEWTDGQGGTFRTTTPETSLDIPAATASKAESQVRVATEAVAARTWSPKVKVGDPPTDGTARPDGVSRLQGPSRYATAAAVSAAAFDTADVVLLATGTAFPDALAGAAVAHQLGAPVLLTDPTTLPAETATELERLSPAMILVLGGGQAVSDAVADAAKAAAGGADAQRLSGRDRYATAAAVAARVPASSTVLLATGTDFPDALAGANLAASLGAPMLLTAPDVLPAATAEVLAERRPDRVVVLGGYGAVSNDVAVAAARAAGGAVIRREQGADRFDTAATVAALLEPSPAVLVATGRDFPDALAGAAVAARLGAPVLLTERDVLPAATDAALRSRGVSSVTVLGGPGAVDDAVVARLTDLLGGG